MPCTHRPQLLANLSPVLLEGAGVMEATQLARLMGNSLPVADYAKYVDGFNDAIKIARIDTPRRLAMFVAQLGHESGGLRYTTELASGAAYEWRADLGNVNSGDGRRYKGRGAIQLTGRANYAAFTRWAHKNKLTTIDFEYVPEEVAQPYWALISAAFYWMHQRPRLNDYADNGDMVAATRAINGGLNGLKDRQQRYQRALEILNERTTTMEKVLDYRRDRVAQETGWFCGPATVQTILVGRLGRYIEEWDLARQLGTHRGGTDYIGQFLPVLNKYLPEARYKVRNLPSYPDRGLKETIWGEITGSINAGYGVAVNIVAPPSNYPRAVAPSTTNLAYGGGTIYHYVAVMGYGEDARGRRVWLADPGFRPFGSWISFDQLCTLIPPKGYAYASNTTSNVASKQQQKQETKQEGLNMDLVKDIWVQLRGVDGQGWSQLGKNQQGQNLTLVDGLAATRADVAGLLKKIDDLTTVVNQLAKKEN